MVYRFRNMSSVGSEMYVYHGEDSQLMIEDSDMGFKFHMDRGKKHLYICTYTDEIIVSCSKSFSELNSFMDAINCYLSNTERKVPMKFFKAFRTTREKIQRNEFLYLKEKKNKELQERSYLRREADVKEFEAERKVRFGGGLSEGLDALAFPDEVD
ncbi:hypothetical protein HY450_01570 [Candidatus Pacearchaeota archaeon]|nr:hypothetical protein [Candidatus Pacearchaeota archaeon]